MLSYVPVSYLSSGGIFGNVPLKMRLMILTYRTVSPYVQWFSDYLSNHFLKNQFFHSVALYFHVIHNTPDCASTSIYKWQFCDMSKSNKVQCEHAAIVKSTVLPAIPAFILNFLIWKNETNVAFPIKRIFLFCIIFCGLHLICNFLEYFIQTKLRNVRLLAHIFENLSIWHCLVWYGMIRCGQFNSHSNWTIRTSAEHPHTQRTQMWGHWLAYTYIHTNIFNGVNSSKLKIGSTQRFAAQKFFVYN